MYGGEVPDTSLENDEQIILLMKAANWFEVESLVDRCTRVLRDRFSVEKITEFLKIADNMSCVPFRQACAEYIAEHVAEVRFRTHEVHFGTETELYTYVKLWRYLFNAIVSNYVFF